MDWPGTPSADPLPVRRTAEGYPYTSADDIPKSAPPAQWPGTPMQAASASPAWPGTPAAAPDKPGLVAKALEPITSYLPTQQKIAGENVTRMGEGIKELGTSGERLGGAFKLATGALGYVGSPIEAALHTIIGKPVEENTGIPHDYTEFAAGLAIPGYGLTKFTKQGQQVAGAVGKAGKTAEKIFSPDTVDPLAQTAAGDIRSAGGRAARDTTMTETAVEPYWKRINALPEADRLNLLDYVENRSGKFAGLAMKDPELQSVANTLRTEFEKRMSKIQALPSHQQAAFIEDYFPHFWKDPAKAQQSAQSFGGGASRQGSGASMKKRTVPTIADGIAMGLDPLTTDPLAATLRYVQSMDRFIAATEVLENAKAVGTVKFLRPKVMGASGNVDSFKVPAGWVALKGRGSTNAAGGQAYAPEGFARVYNNWISRGVAEMGEEYGNAYEAARRASNAVTALELGLSGYHALTMMQESVVNSVANAVGYARKGKPIEAAKSLGKAAVAPVGYAMKGKKLQNVYLGLTPGTQEMKEITEMLTEAGGRAKGAQHAPDYNFSKTGSYVTALKRGALRLQLATDKADIKAAPVLGGAKVAARHIGRIMDTVAQPIFEKYIPLLKNGAFYENMSAWLKANPTAAREEKFNAARQIWDSVDNRFGEMVQDNVFWNKTLKQAAMLGLRSWSWTVGGDIRELGGAVKDTLRAPTKTVKGTGPNDTRWTQKMDYAIALPMVYAAMSAIYQGLKTGEAPQDLQDLKAPRTGGTDPATGQPERLILPGYMKDVFGFADHPVQELTNKVATAPAATSQLLTNKDWRGDPIFPPKDMENAPSWLQAFWNYAVESFGPISVRSIMQGKKAGSNLSVPEQVLGVRTAPRKLTDPEGYDQMMTGIERRRWQMKERHDRTKARLYE